jgi:Heparinase II/III-like protein
VVLGGPRPEPGPPHEEVAWSLGAEAWDRADQLTPANDVGSAAFPKGGLFVLRAGHTHVVARCGDVGQNGNGGHAHNDLLSFELSCGDPFVVDSGTYLYTADPTARNAFRSTRAHNTVVVRGEEINPLPVTELFTLRQAARPKVEEWEVGPRHVRLVASHDGYRRLDHSTVHRRTFTLDRSSGELEVIDELLGSTSQQAESLIHFAPTVDIARIGGEQFRLGLANRSVSLAFFGFERVEQTEAWVSNSYGARTRAPLLVAHVSGAMPLRFGYRFEPLLRTHRVEDPTTRERSYA